MIDCMAFRSIYNIISVLSRWPVHLSMLVRLFFSFFTCTPHNILSKPLAAFPFNDHGNYSQRWVRNKSCAMCYHRSSERNLKNRVSNKRPPILKSCATWLYFQGSTFFMLGPRKLSEKMVKPLRDYKSLALSKLKAFVDVTFFVSQIVQFFFDKIENMRNWENAGCQSFLLFPCFQKKKKKRLLSQGH